MKALFENGAEYDDCHWVRSRLGGVRTRFNARMVEAQILGVPEFTLKYSSGGMAFEVPGLVDDRYDERVNCVPGPGGQRADCLIEVEFVVAFTIPMGWVEWLEANGIDDEDLVQW